MNTHLTVAVNSQADASLINATLVGQGIDVYQLGIERRSLEDIFLQMTTQPGTERLLLTTLPVDLAGKLDVQHLDSASSQL